MFDAILFNHVKLIVNNHKTVTKNQWHVTNWQKVKQIFVYYAIATQIHSNANETIEMLIVKQI